MKKAIQKPTAFVLSLFDTGLGVVRSLGRAGIPVVGLDSNPKMPGFASKYLTPLLSPDPVHAPESLLEFMLQLGTHLSSPGILIPAADAYVMFMARYRKELSEHYLFALPSDSVLDALVDKCRQYALAEQIGIPIARSWYPQSMADVVNIQKELDYPVFIKPYLGHVWRETYGSAHKGFKIDTPDELLARYQEIFRVGIHAMVQSIIVGPDTNLYEASFYIDRQGRPLGIFTHQKLRQYPVGFGVCTYAKSIHDPELVELGLKLMRGFEYRGIGSIEFKRDDRDGRLKLIELNPRIGQQNELAADCGVNLPLIQYRDMMGECLEPVVEYPSGRKWLDLAIDFPSFWQSYQRGETTPFRWLRSLPEASSYPVFAMDDLGPILKKIEYGKKVFSLPIYMLKHRNS